MTYRPISSRRSFFGAAIAVALSLSSTSFAGVSRHRPPLPPATVRLQSASVSLPVIAAIANGYFTDENLTIDYSFFTSSRIVFQQLDQGDVDIVITSADNAVNYRVNPANPNGVLIPAQIILGHDLGLGLALASLSGFPTFESLRGARVGVDTPGSGFALVAAKIMRDHGLEAGIDYTLISGGGSPARLAGLRASPPLFEAAILNADSIVRARADGLPVLGAASDFADPYEGGIGTASEVWLDANPGVAVRFIRAFHRGMAWVKDRSNRARAVLLVTDAATPADLAGQIYDAAVGPGGLDEKISRDGLLNVLKLRQEFNGFATPQDLEYLASPASGLYDLRYYEQALREGECR